MTIKKRTQRYVYGVPIEQYVSEPDTIRSRVRKAIEGDLVEATNKRQREYAKPVNARDQGAIAQALGGERWAEDAGDRLDTMTDEQIVNEYPHLFPELRPPRKVELKPEPEPPLWFQLSKYDEVREEFEFQVSRGWITKEQLDDRIGDRRRRRKAKAAKLVDSPELAQAKKWQARCRQKVTLYSNMKERAATVLSDPQAEWAASVTATDQLREVEAHLPEWKVALEQAELAVSQKSVT